MFDFSQYKQEQNKISSILENLNGSVFFTSQAKTLMQLFVFNVEIPVGLKIDFSSIEEFSFSNTDHKITAKTLSLLLLFLPYEYWKHTINPSIFYNDKVFKDAFVVAASKNNFEFIKECYLQIFNLSKNICFDDNKHQSIFDNPSHVPFPVNRTYIFNQSNSYLKVFNHSCSLLADAWNANFPILLKTNNLSSEEKIKKIKLINSLEKFSLVYIYHIMGNFCTPILSSYNQEYSTEFYNNHLESLSQFKTIKDIDEWCIKNEHLNPKSYVQNTFVSLEEKYHDISFSFFLKHKLSTINQYTFYHNHDNYTSIQYAKLYNKKHNTNLKKVFNIDEDIFKEEYSELEPKSFSFFIRETLKNYLISSNKKKVSKDIFDNITTEIIIGCSLFNSDYLDEYISSLKISKNKTQDKFISMVKSILSYEISKDKFNKKDTHIIQCLALKKLYNSFIKYDKSIENIIIFKIFDKDFSSEEYDIKQIENYLSPEYSAKFLNCLNKVFKTVALTEPASSATEPVNFNYFLTKDIVQSNKNQNLKFLKIIDYTDEIFNLSKDLKLSNNFKVDTHIFHNLNDDIKEHIFMELCQIDKKSKNRSKPLKF